MGVILRAAAGYNSSMYPHRIRLRGPWEIESLDPPGEVRRVNMPARLVECGLGGCRRVRLRRRFGRPRRLDDHERIWLIGEGLGGRGEFRINGGLVGSCADKPFAFPVTHLITERNELVIDIGVGGPGDGLSGDVALEIRCRAYLSSARATGTKDGRLRICGLVEGEADHPLDVYVLAGGKTLAYEKCAAGNRFELTTDSSVNALEPIRVELVAGAVVWYAAEVSAG